MKIMFAAVGSEIISLEALSAVLKQRGHQCALAFDRGLFDDKQYFSVPFLAGLFDDRKRVVSDILDFKPDLLAFSVFADNYQWCLDIARRVKRKMNVPVIVGGVHATSVPDVCIAEDCVDMVCAGEGEYPLLELVESMKTGRVDRAIRNLWFKDNGTVIKNPPRPLIENLDELPLIDKNLFDPFIPISEYYLTVTNKGCIARCSYCSQNHYARWESEHGLGRFYRERSVGSVIAELKSMKERYHFKRVDIKNNVLAASEKWTLAFLEQYQQEIRVPFRIMGHPKIMTPDIARRLKAAGCWHVQIGVESLNPDIRGKILNRHETNAEIRRALSAMDDAGLNYSVDIMVGLPGETDDDIIQAIELLSACKNMIRASIFWLEYLPGVDITAYALEQRFITQEDVDKINRGLQSNYLSTGSIRETAKKEKLLNFQLLFRLLPILPGSLTRFLLRKKYHKIFAFFPQIPVIIAVDILVSLVRKDRWAGYAIYSYGWELWRRVKRAFRSNGPAVSP